MHATTPTKLAALLLFLVSPVKAVAGTTTYGGSWSGGTIPAGDTVVLADGASITGDVTDNGSLRFAATTPLTMSTVLSGTGRLELVSSGTFTLGGLPSGTAALNLGISVAAGQLTIGASGTHALALGAAGTGRLDVSGGRVANGNGWLGATAGGVGLATVSGGTWANSRFLYVGSSGSGTLEVRGGQVSNTTGIVGMNGGSVGLAVISGGTWSNGGQLSVGGYSTGTGAGTGTLLLSGGRVENSIGSVGFNAGSVGTATVSGGTWANSAALFIGRSGSGTLTVTGGLVSSGSSTIGLMAGGVGTAVVSGGTWAMTAGLVVGGSGSGSLTISGSGGSGGTVIVGGTVSAGPSGTIALQSGGTLQIGTGSTTGWLATPLVAEGTLIFDRSDSSTCSTAITGAGDVVKRGSGRLTLASGLQHTGGTIVQAGTLAVGAASSGTGASLRVDAGATFDRGGFGQRFVRAEISGTVTGTADALVIVAGGLLSGSGAITGSTVVAGTHSPGHALGRQTFSGGLEYLAGSSVIWELAANTTGSAGIAYDQIVVPTGGLSFTGATAFVPSFAGAGSVVDWTDPFWSSDHTWLVYDVGSGPTTGFANLALGGTLLDALGQPLSPSRGTFSLGQDGAGVVLTFTAVPEPATLVSGLLGIALAGLGCRRSRARRRP